MIVILFVSAQSARRRLLLCRACSVETAGMYASMGIVKTVKVMKCIAGSVWIKR